MSNSSNLFGGGGGFGGNGGFGSGSRPNAANNGFGSGSRPDTTKNGFGMASRPAPAKNLFGSSGSAPTLFGASAVPAHSINKAEAEASLALTKSEPEPVKPHRQVTRFDPTSPIVSVKVGTSETGIATFYVHHEVLRRSSKFLQAKCEEVWSKSNSTIEISNCSPTAFALYVNWAYSGLISLDEQKKEVLPESQAESDTKPVKQDEQPGDTSDNSQTEPDTKSSAADKPPEESPAKSQFEHVTKENDWIVLAKAYVLGVELVDAKFKNDILATMKFKQWSVDTKTLGPLMNELSSIIYSGTTEGSDARQFLVDLYSARMTKAEVLAKKRTLTPDFAFDVVAAKVPAWS